MKLEIYKGERNYHITSYLSSIQHKIDPYRLWQKHLKSLGSLNKFGFFKTKLGENKLKLDVIMLCYNFKVFILNDLGVHSYAINFLSNYKHILDNLVQPIANTEHDNKCYKKKENSHA